MILKPTAEQVAIIDAAAKGESFIVEAGAGAAKTTTLKMLADNLPNKGPVLAVAFNKRIANDLQAALPPTCTVSTLNSLGHRAWGKQRGKRLEVDARKVGTLVGLELKKTAPEVVAADEDGSCWAAVRGFVNVLRQASYVPSVLDGPWRPVYTGTEDMEDLIEEFMLQNEWNYRIMPVDLMMDMAENVLRDSISMAFQGSIDYDDQIYMSTSFFCPYPQFPTVLADEGQDLSPQNHRQLMLCKPKQLIVVGDRRQAIYAFRGADSESLDNLQLKAAVELKINLGSYKLATSFRCPKKVVERQKLHYPEFVAFEKNPEGEVQTWKRWEIKDVPSGGAILCRNNAPLVAAAFMLLRHKRGFTFYGTDMAKNLKGLIKKVAGFTGKNLSAADKRIPAEDVLKDLALWYEKERAALKDKNREHLVSGLTDRKECARMVLLEVETLGAAMEMCDTIFENAGDLVLSSGHRSKGFEWDWVMHLDPFRIPSRFAKEAASRGSYAQLKQENNLRYVIETRTKFSLIFAALDDNTDAPSVELE